MHKAIVKTCFLSLIALVSFSTTAVKADDGYLVDQGGSPQAIGHSKSIRMVSEIVHMNPATSAVHAHFVFHNDGPATTVTMGFPVTSSGDGVGGLDPKHNSTHFESWVDGMPASIAEVQDHGVDDETSEMWWTKRVHFDSGQTRIIDDSYVGGYGGDSGGNRDFSYVLTSGASWKGPIMHAILICDVSGLPYSPIKVISPDGYKRQAGKIVWDLHNIKPDRDVDMYWYPAYLNVTINGSSIVDEHMGDAWQPKDWGDVTSRRRGDDVWLPAKAAAAWLGGAFRVMVMDSRVRITRGNRWVEATVGSKILKTQAGIAPTVMPFACAEENSPPLPGLGSGAATMVSLRAVVTALGGTCRYDPVEDQMVVSLP